MKELLVLIADFVFENDSNKDYTPKEVLLVILKIVIYLLILIAILYFLLNNKETVAISE